MRMLGGILAGDILFVLLVFAMFRLLGRDPHDPADTQFMAAIAALGILFAIAAGYLAATIAGNAGGALASIVTSRPSSIWVQVATIALAPAAILGGFVRGRTHPQRPQPA